MTIVRSLFFLAEEHDPVRFKPETWNFVTASLAIRLSEVLV
jgi:hypothetical protein